MSVVEALWLEHRSGRSYLSGLVRDIVGLIEPLLEASLLDLKKGKKVGKWIYSAYLRNKPGVLIHLHRRADGEIFYCLYRHPRCLEIYDSKGTRIYTQNRVEKVTAPLSDPKGRLLFVRDEVLIWFDFETLQAQIDRYLPRRTIYYIPAMSPRWLVIQDNLPAYSVYDLVKDTQHRIRLPDGRCEIDGDYLYYWRTSDGSRFILRRIDLRTQQLDPTYQRPFPDLLGNDLQMAAGIFGSYRYIDRTYHLRDLENGTPLKTLSDLNDPQFYRRNGQYYLVDCTYDSRDGSKTYSFYE